jgi:hypothetical protein
MGVAVDYDFELAVSSGMGEEITTQLLGDLISVSAFRHIDVNVQKQDV